MPLPPVTLDDLTWSDLTTAARGRIPAASNGKWTLHAPVDPGVTLLELHAWLLEQRLYWMDQVPDSLTRGALTLLGDAALDAQCASTVLSFAFTPPQPATIAANTLMTLQDSDPPLVFRVLSSVTLLPMAMRAASRTVRSNPACRPRLSVSIGNVDRTTELISNRDICLFTDSGAASEAQITLWLTQPLTPAATSQTLTLAFVLDPTGNEIPAEWAANAASVGAPATLSWWYTGAVGQRTQFPGSSVSDGTGGMRRSGIVGLRQPADWSTPGPDATGAFPYTLWIRADSAAFPTPPRLLALWPNAAIAVHQREIDRRHEVDWLPLPGNALELDADEQPPLVAGTKLQLRERDGVWYDWLPTADLAFHGREDRVFVIDRDAGALRFGNGETGRVPVPGWQVTSQDLADPRSLAIALRDQPDPVSAWVRALLSPGSAGVITAYGGQQPPAQQVLDALLEGLNAAVSAPNLFDATRFNAVTLRPATQEWLAMNPIAGTPAHARLNRLLLEDAYPAALGQGSIQLSVQVGGGSAGDVGVLRTWEIFSASSGPDALAVNIVPAAGGVEPEALDAARQRAAAELRRVERAVISDDFVYLACTTPGVAVNRAHAAVGYNSDFPCLPVPGAVTVFVVPDAPRQGTADLACPRTIAPVPDPGTLQAVSARLSAARLLGTELYVRAPIYRSLQITIQVQSSLTSSDPIRNDIATRLQSFLDPLIGGDECSGWPFGEPIRISAILREAQTALASRGDVAGVGIRLLDVPNATDETCNDVVIGPHALPRLERVVTQVTPVPLGTTGGLQ
jgi:hypothetical protein